MPTFEDQEVLDFYDYIIVFVLGSLGGFISGFLGVGGGIVYIPILDFFLMKLGLRDEALVKAILANSLFTIIFSGSISSYRQYRTGNFFPREILQTALPGVVTAILVTWLIREGNWYSRDVFNYVFAFMLLVIAVRMFFSRPSGMPEESSRKSKPVHYGFTGLLAGIVTAMSGLGGGVIMTPVFTDILKQNIKKASSISNGVIPIFAIVIGLYNLSGSPAFTVHELQIGYIIFPVVIPLVLAAFVFAPLGVHISHKASHRLIRGVFATFVTLVLLKTVYAIFMG